MLADEALYKLLELDFDTVIDVGSGAGEHARILKEHDKDVITVSLIEPAHIIGDFMGVQLPDVDCIWASHVLEHQRNIGQFLDRCYSLLKPNGILAVTVPPSKPNISGGHVSIWNVGLLLYNLILAGFDCSDAKVKVYGYNISIIVRKKKAHLDGLIMDFGDIDKIVNYFPFPVKHDDNINIKEHNW